MKAFVALALLVAAVSAKPRFSCPSEEIVLNIPDDTNCAIFYKCDHGNEVKFNCEAGLIYNPDYEVCDWPYNVKHPGCVGSGGDSPSSSTSAPSSSTSAPSSPSTAAPTSPTTAAPSSPSTAAPSSPSTAAPSSPTTAAPSSSISTSGTSPTSAPSSSSTPPTGGSGTTAIKK